MMSVASRDRPLEISLSAPLRTTMALSGEPLFLSAALKPEASASAPMKIITVSPKPTMVVRVETGRWNRLRRL